MSAFAIFPIRRLKMIFKQYFDNCLHSLRIQESCDYLPSNSSKIKVFFTFYGLSPVKDFQLSENE